MRRECSSTISAVAVYARGAIVTRQVAVPAIDDGVVDLVVPGITVLAEPGTVRARVTGEGWRVLSVQSAPWVPGALSAPPVSEVEVRALRLRIERAREERAHLTARRETLAALALAPGLTPRSHTAQIGPRLRDALVAHAIVDESLVALDERVAAIEQQLRALEHELRAAELSASWAKTDDRKPSDTPTRVVTVRLSGGGALSAVEIDYAVGAARWWPMYTLDIGEGGAACSLWVEALVAQHTGEDWDDVVLSLATSDLVTDARLPELRSIRYGKQQPPPRAGYRPAPEGLDRLFAGWDAAYASMAFAAMSARPAPVAPSVQRRPEPRPPSGTMVLGSSARDGYAARPGSAAPPAKVSSVGGAPREILELSAMEDEMPGAPVEQGMERKKGGFFGGGGGAPAPEVSRSPGGPPMAAKRAADEAEPEADDLVLSVDKSDAGSPDDAWLDFDRLRLGAPEERGRRGRLYVARDDAASDQRAAASRGIAGLDAGAKVVDVLTSRGHYDHRWDASGSSRVPSDGRGHRLRIELFAARPRFRFWAVPREVAEVFREVALDNPTPGPLLTGPVDVYVDGSLLTTSALTHVDRGGVLRVGLGVEDRLRIARNAEVEEDSAGLLGGSTAVDHRVKIELKSSMGRATTVEVFDRLPITEDKGLEVKMVAESPSSDAYKQTDRGAPIRGGIWWRVPIEPGGEATVKFHYRLTMSNKSEVVGGNRRD